jgi:hypothetical protein
MSPRALALLALTLLLAAACGLDRASPVPGPGSVRPLADAGVTDAGASDAGAPDPWPWPSAPSEAACGTCDDHPLTCPDYYDAPVPAVRCGASATRWAAECWRSCTPTHLHSPDPATGALRDCQARHLDALGDCLEAGRSGEDCWADLVASSCET